MLLLKLSSGTTRLFAAIFDPGDEPIAALKAAAAEAKLDAAQLTGIGAFESATVGWFDLAARDYRRIEVDEQVEVVSFLGDITLGPPGSNEPTVHVHAVLGRADGSLVGGHLLAGRVRPTLEVVITEAPTELRRRHDPATGLALIDRTGSAAPQGRQAPEGAH
jgi:uncharacterized protein